MTIAKHTNGATLLADGAVSYAYGTGGYGEGPYGGTLLVDGGYPLAPSRGSVTLDEGWAPFAQATIEMAIPDETTTELLDPREARRIELVLGAEYPQGERPDHSRTFNLGLRDRSIDHETGTMTLSLASDEALLQDYVWLSDTANTDALAYQSSLRSIINSVVLDKIGATLETGTDDSTFYVLSDAENLLLNSGARASASGWIFNPGAGTPNRVTVTIPDEPNVEGTVRALNVNGFAAAASGVGIFNQAGQASGATAVNVTPGQTLHGRAWVRYSHATNARLSFEFVNSVGANLGSLHGSTVAVPADTWTLLTASVTVPANAARAGTYAYTTSATPASFNIWFAAPVVTVDEAADAWFDGDTTDTTEYGYQWAGTANASSSTRAALIDRSPDLLNWQPGVSAWDFIQPLFQVAGFRLFCDEQRGWHLVNGSEYIAEGATQLAVPMNLVRAVDNISRDSDEWFDAALVVYQWNDAADVPTTRYDFYATPGHSRVRTFTIERAYPGPGFAEYLVRRAQGRGRTLDVAALSQYTVTPSQPITVTVPLAPIQTGLVKSVEWGLEQGLMSIQTRGLTDTPPDAWAFGDPEDTWADVPTPNPTWADFDWTDF